MGSKQYIDVETFEYPLYSGRNHPDVATAEGRPPYEDNGSRPLANTDLLDRNAGTGILGSTLRKMTRYMGARLIAFFGDYQIATKDGSLVTDGRKVRIKHIEADDGAEEGYLVRPHDHFLKIDQSDLTAVEFVVGLPSLEFDVGYFSAGIPAQIQSYTAYGAVADDQKDRVFYGRELYIEAEEASGSVEVRQAVDLRMGGLTWYQSTFDTDEWYVAATGGTTPGLTHSPSHCVYMDGIKLQHNAAGPGTLANAGQYGWGDVDGLGFDTYYVYIGAAGVNPNLRDIWAGYGLVFSLNTTGESIHLVSYWDETLADAKWNVFCHCLPGVVPTSTAPPQTTVAPTTIAATTDAPTTSATTEDQ